MHGHFRPLVPDHHDQTRIGHDQRIRLHLDYRSHIVQIRLQFGIMGVYIAGDVKLLATAMRLIDPFFQRLIRRKLVVSSPQAVTGLTGVNGIRTEIIRSAHLFDRTGRQ